MVFAKTFIAMGFLIGTVMLLGSIESALLGPAAQRGALAQADAGPALTGEAISRLIERKPEIAAVVLVVSMFLSFLVGMKAVDNRAAAAREAREDDRERQREALASARADQCHATQIKVMGTMNAVVNKLRAMPAGGGPATDEENET